MHQTEPPCEHPSVLTGLGVLEALLFTASTARRTGRRARGCRRSSHGALAGGRRRLWGWRARCELWACATTPTINLKKQCLWSQNSTRLRQWLRLWLQLLQRSHLRHLQRDWARPSRIYTRTRLSSQTSTPGLGSPLSKRAPGLGSPRATSAPGLGSGCSGRSEPRLALDVRT